MSDMKIVSVSFDRDIEIKPLEERWYLITHEFNVTVVSVSHGVKRIHVDAGFLFDGRSGGWFADAFAPNLGTQDEIKAWAAHDLMYFDTTGFSFDESNEILYRTLRKKCGYGYFRAQAIYWAVQLGGRARFGEPAPTDREYPNLAKIHVEHGAR